MRQWTRRDLVKTGMVAGAGALTVNGTAVEAAAQERQSVATHPEEVHIDIAKNSLRERQSLDFDWRFALGHADDAARDFGFGRQSGAGNYSKSGNAGGATPIHFDDSQWESMQLPHDWAVALPFILEEPLQERGAKPLGREFPTTSIGWYRRSIDVTPADHGKRIVLEFDGVFRAATVFVNGHWVGENMSGYAPFEIDITDFLDYKPREGKNADPTPSPSGVVRNVISLRVDATLSEGWFYEGAGIYRHVWLRKTAPLHLVKDGVFVQSTLEGGSASLAITSEVRNLTTEPMRCTVASAVIEIASGKEVARGRSTAVTIQPDETVTIPTSAKIPAAKLWSLEDRNLYRLVTVVESEGKLIDQDETRFGVRTIAFDANRGFLLNGKPVKIKGVCDHQDHAGVGSAVPDSIQRYRIQRLKDMNCNGLRTSHNTPAAELMDACDELGILVMDETRTFSSSVEALAELSRMIRRDRNRPSVVIWSLANEEPQQSTPRGAAMLTTMKREAKRLDPTRLVTTAMNSGWGLGFTEVVDVMGFNYGNGTKNGDLSHITDFRAKYPNKPAIGTETASTVSTRGIYEDDKQRGYVSAYDINYPSWASTAQQWWSFYDQHDWLAGGFLWTGFDYRGEPTPYGVPCISSHFGVLDTCGFAKDNFHYYRVWWGDEPAIHLFPHWNWEGKEGKEIDVWCYANCESVELFLNGASLGSQKVEKNGHLEWKVKYAPGVIEAKGSTGGKVILTERRETAGPATKLVVEASKTKLRADGQDCAQINVSVVDSKGIPVPVANNMLTFTVEGPGHIIGVGNGDPSCHEPDKATVRSAFNSLAAGFVQTTQISGEVRVKVTAKGLDPAEIVLASTSA